MPIYLIHENIIDGDLEYQGEFQAHQIEIYDNTNPIGDPRIAHDFQGTYVGREQRERDGVVGVPYFYKVFKCNHEY